jgi:site-specific DNA-cytosine methylase
MKWGGIQTLAGGMNLGAFQALGTRESWNISGEDGAYAKNEMHYRKYLLEHGWEGTWSEEFKKQKKVDLVVSVPVCSGISQSSPTAGTENSANGNMLRATEFVLSVQRPQLFIFENSPMLSKDFAKPVADELFSIGTKNGYSLLLYYVKGRDTGAPQIRPRTYAIFRKGKNKLLDIPRTPGIGFEDFCESQVFDENDPMLVFCEPRKPSDHEYYKVIKELYGISGHRDIVCLVGEEANKSLVNVIFDFFGYDYGKLLAYTDSTPLLDTRNKKLFRRFCEKYMAGKNIWDHRIIFIRNCIAPSMITRAPVQWIHPFEDRFLYVRELLRLMTMPDDYNFILPELTGKRRSMLPELQPIMQNVCPQIASQVISAAVRSELPIPHTYVAQTHKTNAVSVRSPGDNSLVRFL